MISCDAQLSAWFVILFSLSEELSITAVFTTCYVTCLTDKKWQKDHMTAAQAADLWINRQVWSSHRLFAPVSLEGVWQTQPAVALILGTGWSACLHHDGGGSLGDDSVNLFVFPPPLKESSFLQISRSMKSWQLVRRIQTFKAICSWDLVWQLFGYYSDWGKITWGNRCSLFKWKRGWMIIQTLVVFSCVWLSKQKISHF